MAAAGSIRPLRSLTGPSRTSLSRKTSTRLLAQATPSRITAQILCRRLSASDASRTSLRTRSPEGPDLASVSGRTSVVDGPVNDPPAADASPMTVSKRAARRPRAPPALESLTAFHARRHLTSDPAGHASGADVSATAVDRLATAVGRSAVALWHVPHRCSRQREQGRGRQRSKELPHAWRSTRRATVVQLRWTSGSRAKQRSTCRAA